MIIFLNVNIDNGQIAPRQLTQRSILPPPSAAPANIAAARPSPPISTSSGFVSRSVTLLTLRAVPPDYDGLVRPRLESEGCAMPMLLVVWLLFFGLLAVYGLSTSQSYGERLAKAWEVQDNAGASPGESKAVRAILAKLSHTP